MQTSIPFALWMTYESVKSPFTTAWKSCLSNPDFVFCTSGSLLHAAKIAMAVKPQTRVLMGIAIGVLFCVKPQRYKSPDDINHFREANVPIHLWGKRRTAAISLPHYEK